MKPSQELFVLIKSLSKSEKRFFKLNSTLQQGEKNYLKIFDFIDQSEEYDEAELKKVFQHETFVHHLPSEKNHLYRLILKSLRLFHSEQSISSRLKEELKNIEILFNKALYKECGKFLNRAKKLAQDHEKFYYWIEFIAWEKRLIEEQYESGVFNIDLSSIVKEEAEVLERLRNLAEYHILYAKINAIFRSGGFSRNKQERETVNAIADHPLIKGKHTALSYRAASICYYIKGLCAVTNRNYTESAIHFQKTKDILDRNSKIRFDLGKRYLQTLSHLFRSYLEERNFEKAQKTLDEISDLGSEKEFQVRDLKIKLYSIVLNEQIYLFNLQGAYDKSKVFIEESLDLSWLLTTNQMSKEQRLWFHYNCAYTFFGLGDFKRSLNYINDILNDNEQKLRQDIMSFARLLNIIVHIELNNFDYLEYLVKSTSRFLKKIKRDTKMEQVFLSYMKKLSKYSDNNPPKTIYEEMHNEFSQILKDNDERVFLTYFDILRWTEAKKRGIPFASIDLETNSHG